MPEPKAEVIVDPRQAALEEVQAEDKLEKEGLDKEEIEAKKTPAPKEEEPEEKSDEDSEKEEKEAAKVAEDAEKALAKEAQELGLEKDATEEEIVTAREDKAEKESTERTEKAVKLGLKEDATDDEIKTADEKAQKDAFDVEVKELAETENVTLDQARKHLESVDGILKKYESNPKKLASAYRNQQAEFHKMQAENAQLKVATSKERILTADEFSVGNRVFSKSKVVENYKKAHPEETEDLEDPQVFLMAKPAFEAEVTKAYTEHERKMAAVASAKRIQLIDNLGEGDKKFVKEIKEVLDVYPDNLVVKEGFNLKYIASVAKGEKYDEVQKNHKAALKAEFERGLKAGKEGARIKIPGGESPKGKGKASLSDSEKSQARSMYAALTEDEAYEAFKEVGLKEYREEKQK